MIARFDELKQFGPAKAFKGGGQRFLRPKFVHSAVYEHFRKAARRQIIETAQGGGEANRDQASWRLAVRARERAAKPEDYPRPEGKSGKCKRKLRIHPTEIPKRGPRILHFADSMRMLAMAQVHAAKIEAQNHAAGAAHSTGYPIDNLVVHRAAIERMRMAYEARLYRVTILRLLEKRFQTAGGSLDEVRFDSTRHVNSTDNS